MAAVSRNSLDEEVGVLERDAHGGEDDGELALELLADLAGSSERASTAACRAICAASWACGRPEPEKIGSFWPRTSGFSPSIAETPVWMKSSGKSRAVGLIGAAVDRQALSGMISGPVVARTAEAVEDAAEHVARDAELEPAAQEADLRLARVGAARALEGLHEGDVAR